MNPFDTIKTDNVNINPFDIKTDTVNIDIDNIIDIRLEILKRKKNTYITGWNISEQEIKDHLKYIKKKIGCNGTVKIIDNNNTILLQGNHCNFMQKYLTEQGIDINTINIKGL